MGIVTKLAEVMAEAGYVQKDGRNDHHGYRFVSAEAVYDRIRPALARRGVAIASTTAELLNHDQVTSAKGVPGVIAVVRLTLQLKDAETGEVAIYQGLGSGSDSGAKAVMKANTAALKYALAAALMMSWGDDPEAHAAAGEDRPTPAAAPAKPAGKRAAKAAPAVSPAEASLLAMVAAMGPDDVSDVQTRLKAAVADLDEPAVLRIRTAFREARDRLGVKLTAASAANGATPHGAASAA